jgi:hypothetical protein
MEGVYLTELASLAVYGLAQYALLMGVRISFEYLLHFLNVALAIALPKKEIIDF